MEEKSKIKGKSKFVSLFLLIPAFIFVLISLALSIIAFGLIPIVPSIISIVLAGASWFLFKKSFRIFTLGIMGLAIISALYAIVQGTLIKKEISADVRFDSVTNNSQLGVDSDLGDAFNDEAFEGFESSDTSAVLTDFQIGEQLYLANCVACHMANGSGIEGTYPPLADSNFLKNTDKTIEALLFGLKDKTIVNGIMYDKPMPASDLSDEEIVKVLNYVFSAWGNSLPQITVEQVQEIKAKKGMK